MKWLKNKSRCGHIVLWLLNNRIFFFYQPFRRGYSKILCGANETLES